MRLRYEPRRGVRWRPMVSRGTGSAKRREPSELVSRREPPARHDRGIRGGARRALRQAWQGRVRRRDASGRRSMGGRRGRPGDVPRPVEPSGAVRPVSRHAACVVDGDRPKSGNRPPPGRRASRPSRQLLVVRPDRCGRPFGGRMAHGDRRTRRSRAARSPLPRSRCPTRRREHRSRRPSCRWIRRSVA